MSSEKDQVLISDFNTSKKVDGGGGGGCDPISDAIGSFGRWQRKAFFCLGLFFMNAALPTLLLTFLNVQPERYWCRQPEGLNLDQQLWLNVSGQNGQHCNIFKTDYFAYNKQRHR